MALIIDGPEGSHIDPARESCRGCCPFLPVSVPIIGLNCISLLRLKASAASSTSLPGPLSNGKPGANQGTKRPINSLQPPAHVARQTCRVYLRYLRCHAREVCVQEHTERHTHRPASEAPWDWAQRFLRGGWGAYSYCLQLIYNNMGILRLRKEGI